MKKLIQVITILVLSSNVALGQFWTNPTSNLSCIERAGQIKVDKITLGHAWFGHASGYIGINMERLNCGNGSWTYGTDGASNGAGAMWNSMGGDFLFSTKMSTGGTGGTLTDNDILNNIKFSIRSHGQVIIGDNQWNGSWYSNNPGGYRLIVDEGILTEKIKVAVKGSTDWSDYVFAPNYDLMPLADVETFVKKNRHLPNVPSADEVVKNGIDLAKMDAKLLEKIEELTLYMIELKKENARLSKAIELLK